MVEIVIAGASYDGYAAVVCAGSPGRERGRRASAPVRGSERVRRVLEGALVLQKPFPARAWTMSHHFPAGLSGRDPLGGRTRRKYAVHGRRIRAIACVLAAAVVCVGLCRDTAGDPCSAKAK